MEHWHVTLEESTYHWYDQVARFPDSQNDLREIRRELKNVQQKARKSTNRRFVYFLVSRPKIRIAPSRKIRRELFSNRAIIKISLGNDEVRRKFAFDLKRIVKKINSFVEITDRFVLVEDAETNVVKYNVHQFLQKCGFSFRAPSTVRYVGDTGTPFNRLLKREHRGLFDMVYNLGLNDFDYFIFTHIINVTRHNRQRPLGDDFFTLNLSSSKDPEDPIDLNKEGVVVENALIEYFYCEFQDVNRKRDRGKLRNALEFLKSERGVFRILGRRVKPEID